MAGESARDMARRQREKAARLERSAALWEQGAVGEEAVATALAALPPEWIVVNDVRWPGRRFANIDHVVVGPGGVFVIDAKNWSGSVDVVDGVLRQEGRHRELAVAGGADAALAVAELASLDPSIVHPVLCFVRDEWMSGWARDVMVCSIFNLVAMLESRPTVLAGGALESTRTLVSLRLQPATGHRSAGASRRMPAKRPRGRRRSNVGLRLVGLFAMCLIALFALPLLLPAIGEIVAERVTARLEPRSVDVGTTVTVPATSGRPTLELTAVGVKVAKGSGPTRRASVRLALKNLGSFLYDSGANFKISLVDQDGAGFQPLASGRGLGRAIDDGLRLRPGESIEGVVRFELPAGSKPDEVAVSLGPATDDAVSWRMPDR